MFNVILVCVPLEKKEKKRKRKHKKINKEEQ